MVKKIIIVKFILKKLKFIGYNTIGEMKSICSYFDSFNNYINVRNKMTFLFCHFALLRGLNFLFYIITLIFIYFYNLYIKRRRYKKIRTF